MRRASVKKDTGTPTLVANLMTIKSMVQGVNNNEKVQEMKEEPVKQELSVIPAAKCIRSSHESIERAKELCRPSELYFEFNLKAGASC
jgi:hypothetical protein